MIKYQYLLIVFSLLLVSFTEKRNAENNAEIKMDCQFTLAEIEALNENLLGSTKFSIKAIEEAALLNNDFLPIHQKVNKIEQIVSPLRDKISTILNEFVENSDGLNVLAEYKIQYTNYGFKKVIPTTDIKKNGLIINSNPELLKKLGSHTEDLEKITLKTSKELKAIIIDLVETNKNTPINNINFDGLEYEQILIGLYLENTLDSLKLEKNDPTNYYRLLLKISNRIKGSSEQIVSYLYSLIERSLPTEDVNTNLKIVSVPSKEKIKLGEVYKTNIGLNYPFKIYRISISINARNLPIDRISCEFKMKPTTVGTSKYDVMLIFVNPISGKSEMLKQSFSFEVLPN